MSKAIISPEEYHKALYEVDPDRYRFQESFGWVMIFEDKNGHEILVVETARTSFQIVRQFVLTAGTVKVETMSRGVARVTDGLGSFTIHENNGDAIDGSAISIAQYATVIGRESRLFSVSD